MSIAAVLMEARKEMERQVDKWGWQNWPSLRAPKLPGTPVHELYRIPTEHDAKERCNAYARSGALSYFDILLEEVCEVAEAPDDEARREELIQVAAVALSWVGAIDRRSGRQ